MIRVLFLCRGNICRSPMAEAVFQRMVSEAGLHGKIDVDSAGISQWHAGERPHHGTIEVLTRHSTPHEWMRSRQIQTRDLDVFDYIAAMDSENMQDLAKVGRLRENQAFRLLDLVPDSLVRDVPDPWYTGNFDEVYDLVSRGCEKLLDKIKHDHPELYSTINP